MASDKKFNVGIIGYGMSAHIFHIPWIELIPSFSLYAIVQRHPAAGNSAPADYPALKHYTAAETLLADAAVDIVVITTPPDNHAALARAALEAGKHVLVEKPFVPNSAAADELVALARARGRVLTVYQNRRWDVDFLTLQQLLASGRLGRVYEFETHYDRFRPDKPATWKGTLDMARGGGAIFDLGTHLLDQVFVLFGLPTGVTARFANQREGRLVTGESADDEPDSISLVLGYADKGLLVYVRIGIMSVESRQLRFWVRGTQGSYRKTGLDPQEPQIKAGMKLTDAGFGVEDPAIYGTLSALASNGSGDVVDEVYPAVEPTTYLEFYKRFAKAVETGREEDNPVPAAEAAQVLRIIEAARESAKTGREVVPK